jgi:hypothetical protein
MSNQAKLQRNVYLLKNLRAIQKLVGNKSKKVLA